MPQKDDKLLHDLVVKYAKLFAKHAYRCGVPYDDAEDIAMESIWAYYDSHLYEGKDEVEAKRILARIVRNRSIDYLRKEKHGEITKVDIDDEEVYVQLSAPERYEPESTIVADEGYQNIVNAIENLKPIWRDTVKLYFLEERSYAEISEALGISEDVCRSRISRARKVLEQELKDRLK